MVYHLYRAWLNQLKEIYNRQCEVAKEEQFLAEKQKEEQALIDSKKTLPEELHEIFTKLYQTIAK